MARHALITGATGFMGRHLTRRLLTDGWKVAVLARNPRSAPDWISSQCSVIPITDDVDAWAAGVEDFSPEACFHLAAQSIQVHNRQTIAPLIAANVSFGVQLLDVVSGLGPVRFVNVGSMWQHHDSRQYGPSSLYAATKQAFVDILQYFAECTDVMAATVEFPDTYGPDDDRQKLLRLLVRASESGEPLRMSPGGQIVEMIHIDDVVDALLMALEVVDHDPPSFQVPGEVLKLKEFVALVSLFLGKTVPVEWGARPYRPRETMEPWRYHGPVPGWQRSKNLYLDLPSALERDSVVRLPVPRQQPVELPGLIENDLRPASQV